MAEKEFLVGRPHIGDRPYEKGETRIANPVEVQHLVASGTLIDPDGIVEEDEGAAPETKAETPPETKAKPQTKAKE